MTEILVAAMAHSPGLTAFPDRPDAAVARKAFASIDALRQRIERHRPDVVVGVANDHFTATSMSCLAPFAVATGSAFRSPATPGLASFLGVPESTIPGQRPLARSLLRGLHGAGVDAAELGGRFGFDENFAVPIHLLALGSVPFVPLIVNAVQPPMPTPRRCLEVGRHLGDLLQQQTTCERVLVLATGGLSHRVGTPGAGRIDTDFDRRVLEQLAIGDLHGLAQLDEATISAAGNGAEEVRQWLLAAGVAGGPLEVLGYEPVPEWLSAVAVACSEECPIG